MIMFIIGFISCSVVIFLLVSLGVNDRVTKDERHTN